MTTAPYLIQNFISLYERSFKDNWELPCLTYYPTGETLTYGQFAENIAKIHTFFEVIGIKPGDKVAVCGKDTIPWVTMFMATVTYGGVIVPILSDFNPADVAHIVNHSDADIFFVDNSIWEQIDCDSLLNIKGVITLDKKEVVCDREEGEVIKTALKNLEKRFEEKYPAGFGTDDVRYTAYENELVREINYTSGTTGFSKGVMLTGENLAGNVCFAMYVKIHYRQSHTLAVLPLAHAYGQAFDMLSPLAAGSRIFLLGKIPSPKVLLKALKETKPSVLLCVPLVLEKIYRNQIVPMLSKGAIRWTLMVPFLDDFIYSQIRKKLIEAFGGEFYEIIVGGAALNKEVEEFLHKIKFPFIVGYGMTECGPLISYEDWHDFKPGSCGRILPTMQVMAIGEEDGKPGEICVKGSNVMKGYYKNPEATALVLDKDGWLKTGDMGTISDNETIFLRGRSKTMILSASGQNIYPEEIEAKLNNMPFVAESLVVERDKKLIALVYPDYDALDNMGLTTQSDREEAMEKVRKDLNAIVAPYEQISKIVLQPQEFEKTPKRSIKRFLYTI